VDEQREEQIIGIMLRVGVILSAVVVMAGAALYLWRHGQEHPDFGVFHGVPDDLKHPGSIVQVALGGHGRGLIQLGLLLLIATPIARVAFSVFAFERQRDWTYVGITFLVLAVLVYSLIGGS
jgi:uncharacterized membrane protein